MVLFDLGYGKEYLKSVKFHTPNRSMPQALGNNGKIMVLNKNVFGQDGDGGSSSRYKLIMGILRP